MTRLNGTLPWLQVWTSHTISTQDPPAQIVKIASPQLHELQSVKTKRGLEREAVVLWNAQIIAVVKFNGADWDADTAHDTAEVAYAEANWMTIAEVKYFITRMKAGKYPHKKNLSPVVFMECLNDYINEILATRGAVNSYAWRDNRVPDEDFQLKPNTDTGEPGKPADPDVMKVVLSGLAERFKNMEQIQREEDERARKARWKGLKDQRDQQIVDLVERDAAQGIAPDKYMAKRYFEALDQLAGKDL